MNRAQARVEARERIHTRIRRKVEGTPERPRLAIRRTLKYIYAQIVDDASGHTLAQASSREESVLGGKKNVHRGADSAQRDPLTAAAYRWVMVAT